ncbi:MAG: TRAP transporter substrate-binding protein DctP, partial [Rubrivivax sp.]
EQQAIMKSLGYTPVPLETADALAAIQTGMIDVLPSTPYFALASQIHGTAKHMLEINWAPIVGALVITQRAWAAMSPAGQQALLSAGDKAGLAMRTQARKEVDEATAAMVRRGLTVSRPNEAQLREWQQLAEQLYPRIRGTMVPADTFDEVFTHVRAYRAGKR